MRASKCVRPRSASRCAGRRSAQGQRGPGPRGTALPSPARSPPPPPPRYPPWSPTYGDGDELVAVLAVGLDVNGVDSHVGGGLRLAGLLVLQAMGCSSSSSSRHRVAATKEVSGRWGGAKEWQATGGASESHLARNAERMCARLSGGEQAVVVIRHTCSQHGARAYQRAAAACRTTAAAALGELHAGEEATCISGRVTWSSMHGVAWSLACILPPQMRQLRRRPRPRRRLTVPPPLAVHVDGEEGCHKGELPLASTGSVLHRGPNQAVPGAAAAAVAANVGCCCCCCSGAPAHNLH